MILIRPIFPHRSRSIVRAGIPILLALLALAGCGDESGDTFQSMPFNQAVVEYGDNVDTNDVRRLGDFLVQRGFLRDRKSIRLEQASDGYVISMSAADGMERDVTTLATLRALGMEISKNVFNDAKVQMRILGEGEENATVIPPPDYGTRLDFNRSDLFYTQTVTREEANRLGEFLVRDGFFQGEPKTTQLNKADGIYQFRFMVVPGRQNDADFVAACRDITILLSQKVFNGAPVEIHLCDQIFSTLAVVKSEPNP